MQTVPTNCVFILKPKQHKKKYTQQLFHPEHTPSNTREIPILMFSLTNRHKLGLQSTGGICRFIAIRVLAGPVPLITAHLFDAILCPAQMPQNARNMPINTTERRIDTLMFILSYRLIHVFTKHYFPVIIEALVFAVVSTKYPILNILFHPT